MAKGLRNLAQLPMCMRSSQQTEEWLQTHLKPTPLMHFLGLPLSTIFSPMALGEVNLTENPLIMSGADLAPMSRSLCQTTR